MSWKVHSADYTGEGRLHLVDQPNTELHLVLTPAARLPPPTDGDSVPPPTIALPHLTLRLYLGNVDTRKCPVHLLVAKDGVVVVRWLWMRPHWPKLLRGVLAQLYVPNAIYEAAIMPAIAAAYSENRVHSKKE